MQRFALLALAAFTTMTFAGCLSGDGDDGGKDEQFDDNGLPYPVLLCFDAVDEGGAAGLSPRCNFEMTPDEGREGNEVTIAVNPKDPRNIVGGAKDYYPPDAGECVWDGVYVTHDGGRTTYEDRSFDGSPWRAIDGDLSDFEPNYASTFWCTTDPVAYFNVEGNLYYLLMAYQTDPITGSKLGEGVLPLGALNDWAFNRAVQIVAISDDGGDTFHTFTPVLEGTFPITFHDKGWIAASADGTVHVMWWAAYLPGNLYFRSTDGGQTYTDFEILSTLVGVDGVGGLDLPPGQAPGPAPGVGTGSAGQGSFVEVGTAEQVYVIWNALNLIEAVPGGAGLAADGGVQMRRSFDTGATWDDQRAIQEFNSAGMPGLEARDRRGGFPGIGTDRNPDSPFADAVYIFWQDACQEDTWAVGCGGGGSAMWFIASFDEGETWTEPIRVSDPPADSGDAVGVADQVWNIFPTISVSPGGVIDVSWMSTRDQRLIDCHDGAPDCAAGYGDAYPTFTQHYAYSLDGGKTWSKNHDVRDAADGGWDPAKCHHQNGMVFIGDYNDIDSSWQAAHPVWPDTRHGVCDVYTATIQRPMFAEGWDPDARADAEAWIAAHPL